MTNRNFWQTAVAASVVLVGTFASSAHADIDWVVQSNNSQITFTGQMGTVLWNFSDGSLGGTNGVEDANGDPLWVQQYVGVPQTDAGTSYNGFNNSMVTNSVGQFTTNGNNFLSSLNFGAKIPNPGPAAFEDFQPHIGFGISGNWLPQNDTGGDSPGEYGAATLAQAGITLVGAAGQNYNNSGPLSPVVGGGPLDTGGGPNGTGTAGRAALVDTAGNIHSNGSATPVDANGNFDGHVVNVQGLLAFAVNFQGDLGYTINTAQTPQSIFQLFQGFTSSSLGNISNDFSGAQALGSITRDGPLYIMSIPYQASLNLGTKVSGTNGTVPDYPSNVGYSTYFDLKFTSNFHAAANIRAGDSNFDGVVNGLDISQIASNWLHTNAAKLGPGDVNGDGVVNGLDISLVASNWLKTTPALPALPAPLNPYGGNPPYNAGAGNANSVPEPGTWFLLFSGLASMLAIRRRVRS